MGGRPATDETWVIRSTAVQTAPRMRERREAPGACVIAGDIYLFGGIYWKDRLFSCEKYSIKTKEWGNIGKMQTGRAYFTPCPYEGLVYLLDLVWKKTCLEVFSPSTGLFSSTNVTITGLSNHSLCAVIDDELLIFSVDGDFARYSLPISSESPFSLTSSPHIGSNVLCLTPPLVLNRTIYWVELDTGAFWQADSSGNVRKWG